MESHFQQKYIPSSKHIYYLIDNLEDKLSRYKGYSSNGINYPYNNNIYYKNNQINNSNNSNEETIKDQKDMFYQNNTNDNPIIETDNIRSIIINEFNSLMLPYQKDFNTNFYSLESKINIINARLDRISNNNNSNIIINNEYFNNKKLNNKYNNNINEYITREEFEAKIQEYDNQISIMNSLITTIKNIIEKKLNQNNNNNNNSKDNSNNNYDSNNNINNELIMKEIEKNNENIKKEMQSFKDTINKNIELINQMPKNQMKEYDIQMNIIKEDLNYIKEDYKKLNDELYTKNEKIYTDIETKLKEKNIDKSNNDYNNQSLINEINNQNQKILKLENTIQRRDEDNSNNITHLKKEISDLELKLDNINIKNTEYPNNNINRSNIATPNTDVNNKNIEDIINNYLQDFKKENEKHLNELISKIDEKNEMIFKLFEEHNVAIKNMNTKIEKIKNNLEIDNKKKFNHLTEKIEKSIMEINESNIGFNNESRYATNILGNDKINILKSQLTNNDKKIEKLNEELKDKIIEITEHMINNDKRISLLEKQKSNILDNNNISERIQNNNNNNNLTDKGIENDNHFLNNNNSNNNEIIGNKTKGENMNSFNSNNKEEKSKKSFTKNVSKKDDEPISIESLII